MNGDGDKRPYAAASNVLAVLGRCRTRNLPDKIDNDFVRLAGVPEVVLNRSVGTMQFLGFTDDNGRPTETLQALAAAPEERYREILASAVKKAYAADFDRIDPAQDTQKQIIDAFRPYQPRSQTSRMVMLFLALCREGGIEVKEAPRERAMGSTVRPGGSRPARSQDGKSAGQPKQDRQPRRHGHDGAPLQSLPANLLFTVTDEDVSVLTDDEFAAVWSALGKVARARALARSSPAPQDSAESDSDAEEGDS